MQASGHIKLIPCPRIARSETRSKRSCLSLLVAMNWGWKEMPSGEMTFRRCGLSKTMTGSALSCAADIPSSGTSLYPNWPGTLLSLCLWLHKHQNYLLMLESEIWSATKIAALIRPFLFVTPVNLYKQSQNNQICVENAKLDLSTLKGIGTRLCFLSDPTQERQNFNYLTQVE